MPWATVDVVGDTSPYVSTIVDTLEADIPHIRKWLTDCPGITAKHWSLFLDIFVTRFSANYLDAIYRCKRISEVGAQSLLLDVSCIRSTLAKLPILGTPEAAATTITPGSDDLVQPLAAGTSPPGRTAEQSRFVKFVESSMRKAEVLLKVVLAPQETLAHTYMALVTGGNLENFQRIIDLKGLSKSERQQLVEAFQQRQTAILGTASSTTASTSTDGGSAIVGNAGGVAATAVSATSLAPSSSAATSSGSSVLNPQTAQEFRAKTKSIIGKMLGPLHSNP